MKRTPSNTALREVEDGDHAWLVDLHNAPDVLRNLTHPMPITFDEHLEWWARTQRNPTEKRLIFTVNEVRAGFTKFYSIDLVNRNCTLGADIHADFRGKGLAKHMWGLMLDLCFGPLDLHRVGLTTADFNYVGYHVYRSLGFRAEGQLVQSLHRDGRFHDQLLMHMLHTDWNTHHRAPL